MKEGGLGVRRGAGSIYKVRTHQKVLLPCAIRLRLIGSDSFESCGNGINT